MSDWKQALRRKLNTQAGSAQPLGPKADPRKEQQRRDQVIDRSQQARTMKAQAHDDFLAGLANVIGPAKPPPNQETDEQRESRFRTQYHETHGRPAFEKVMDILEQSDNQYSRELCEKLHQHDRQQQDC